MQLNKCEKGYFEKTLLEENFDDFFEDREESRVMNANSSHKQRQHARNLWYLAKFTYSEHKYNEMQDT